MPSLGVLVLTYNEAENIKDCLESVKWVDEIVIIDSFSSDRTIAISRDYTDKIYQRKFDDFSSQRNLGLEKIDSEWILVLDADERISAALKEEIKRELSDPKFEGYYAPRKNYFLGKWIKYCGWYPDYVLRLFKKNASNQYNGLVHEGIQIKGKVGRLKNALIHYTYRDLEHYLNKTNLYTTLGAKSKYLVGKRKGLAYILLRPGIEFVNKYLLKKGFLLGKEGLFLAILSSYYQFLKYVKLWELNKINQENKK